MSGAALAGVNRHHLQTVLLSLDQLLRPSYPAELVAARVGHVPTPAQQVAGVLHVGVQDTVHTNGVLQSAVASIRAERSVMQFERARGIHKGRIVELFGFAAAFLPDKLTAALFTGRIHLFGHQPQGFFPGGLAPFAWLAFAIGSNQRRFDPVGIVEGHNLPNALRAQRAVVARICRVTFQLDNPAVDHTR